MQGRHPSHRREGQGFPTAGSNPVTELNPIVPIAKGNGEVPLGGVAIHHHFLHGVLVGGTSAKTRDICYPQHQLTGTIGHG